MRGLSMRDYKLVLQQSLDAVGLEKSTVNESFMEASRKRQEELMSRSLEPVQLCNVLAHVPDPHQHWFKYRLRLAYAHAEASDARQALYH